MDEDERRRFAMKNEGGTDSAQDELDLENPRTSDTLEPPASDTDDDLPEPDDRP
ncbi:MAG: hypothetical protein H0T68_03890 [Gemmatimonadales bacterium]|nr:hypothetical protein [Gemmatimonadales bacterium]